MNLIKLPESGLILNLDHIVHGHTEINNERYHCVVHFVGGDRIPIRGNDAKYLINVLHDLTVGGGGRR